MSLLLSSSLFIVSSAKLSLSAVQVSRFASEEKATSRLSIEFPVYIYAVLRVNRQSRDVRSIQLMLERSERSVVTVQGPNRAAFKLPGETECMF